MINVSTNDHPFSPFVKSVPMQSMLRIVVGRASLTMPELALVQEAVVTGAVAARQKAVFGRATVASPALISEAAGRIHAQTIPYEVPYCRCS